jgi:hypothetical protein
MADDKKDTGAKKPKPAAKAPDKPAAKAPEKAVKAAEGKPAAAKADKKPSEKTARSKATPAVADGPTCRVEGCKQGVRAKGFCRKHFISWRRGAVGDHHRYKTCSKEACRKPRVRGGLCEEHAGIAAPAGATPAEGAPPA